MAHHPRLDPSTLSSFHHAAAGHDGVLSDPTGDLVIKPCTAGEVSFYESANAAHPAFASYMPTYMGTLRLNASKPAPTSDFPPSKLPTIPHSTSDPNLAPSKGEKIPTDLAIVLDNVATGFTKPNILDLKLGARLWDEHTRHEKRVRLDKVAEETTSGSLAFRIAGMRVWQGHRHDGSRESKPGDAQNSKEAKNNITYDSLTEYNIYDKLYGRQFSAEDVIDAFREYLYVPLAGIGREKAAMLTRLLATHTRNIQNTLEQEESRMYSASILFVYEGDGDAIDRALKLVPGLANSGRVPPEDEKARVEDRIEEVVEEGNGDDYEDGKDDDEEPEQPKIVAVKMIDFAHASWTPGQGPDENALKGVRNVHAILAKLAQEFAADSEETSNS